MEVFDSAFTVFIHVPFDSGNVNKAYLPKTVFMKTDMSSFDIMAVVSELKGDMRIKKIYQPTPAQLRVLLRYRDGEVKNLIVEVGKKIYLSDYAMPSPRQPSNFAMTLRKHLGNAVVTGVRQVGFDRIVELTVETGEGEFKLVFELFGEGNSLLIDSEGIIRAVMKRRRFKHRELIGKNVYEYPPQRTNPFEIDARELKEIVDGYGSLVKALAGPLGLGGQYGEEICLRSGVDKNVTNLSLDDADKVISTLGELKKGAFNPSPVIVFDGAEPVDVTPVRLQSYEGRVVKEFPSFSAALDEFFTERVMDDAMEKVESKYREGLTSINMRLQEQARAIRRFNQNILRGKQIGDIIYANFSDVETLIDTVSKARKNMSVGEIKKQLKAAPAVQGYNSKEGVVTVLIDKVKFNLDLNMSASKNADNYYSKSKKARVKLKGARGAAEKTKAQIRDYVKKGRTAAEKDVGVPVKRAVRKLKWYERFRWFRSSDGLLVVGGRDATSNETIVKRHMEKGDVFFHADIHGAPAVVVKAEGQPVPEQTLEEAAQFAASNSIAWRSDAAFLDVYWVNPEQVSKTPQSGEYVGKGAFIIRGKRNFIRSKVALSVGVKIDEDTAHVMAGPEIAVQAYAGNGVNIIPGRMKSKEAAMKIKEMILEQTSDADQSVVKKLNIDDIQRALPTGGYAIVRDRKR